MEQAAVPSAVREERLEQWINDYSDDLLRICFLYLSDRHLAQDALQDTFLKAWKSMAQFEKKQIRSEKAWLLRIAINVSKDYRRGKWFRHVNLARALDELPPRLVSVEMEDRALTMDVGNLPDKLKQVILLYYYENLSLQETADALGIPKATAYKRLKRAEELLRLELTGGEEA